MHAEDLKLLQSARIRSCIDFFGNEVKSVFSLKSFFMPDLKIQDSLVFRNCVGKLGELFPVHISAFDPLGSLEQII